jgi:hypothetical protein
VGQPLDDDPQRQHAGPAVEVPVIPPALSSGSSPSSPLTQPATSGDVIGSGPSQSKHCHEPGPLPPGFRAKVRGLCAPLANSLSQLLWFRLRNAISHVKGNCRRQPDNYIVMRNLPAACSSVFLKTESYGLWLTTRTKGAPSFGRGSCDIGYWSVRLPIPSPVDFCKISFGSWKATWTLRIALDLLAVRYANERSL